MPSDALVPSSGPALERLGWLRLGIAVVQPPHGARKGSEGARTDRSAKREDRPDAPQSPPRSRRRRPTRSQNRQLSAPLRPQEVPDQGHMSGLPAILRESPETRTSRRGVPPGPTPALGTPATAMGSGSAALPENGSPTVLVSSGAPRGQPPSWPICRPHAARARASSPGRAPPPRHRSCTRPSAPPRSVVHDRAHDRRPGHGHRVAER